MDNYFVKINIINKNGKKYFDTCELHKNHKIIKKYDRDITKTFFKYVKEENINYYQYSNYLIVNDIKFIDKYLGIPADKVLHINPYVGMVITTTSLVLSALGIRALENKYEEKENVNTSITYTMNDEPENDINKNEDSTENTDDIMEFDNNSLFYQPVKEDSNKPHVIIFSDNDYNLENSTNEALTLSSADEIDESCTYYFENKDNSNEKSVSLIDLIYGDDIKPLANNYGFSYNFILADICQENGNFSVRYSTQGGVGPMQVEWYIWDGNALPDIDGTNYTFDCAKLNNISNDFEKMFKVSLYKHIFEDQNISKEQLADNINNYLNIIIDDYSPDDYNNIVNYFNEYYNIINNASSFEEAKSQTLNYFNISDENIIQYKNAIEGVKAGSLILRYNLDHIYDNNNNNYYNYKLSNYDMGIFTIWSQNKGSTCVDDCLKVTYNTDDTENAIKRTPYGDNNYLSNVFSYVSSDNVISMRLENGEWINIKPHNLTLDNSMTK